MRKCAFVRSSFLVAVLTAAVGLGILGCGNASRPSEKKAEGGVEPPTMSRLRIPPSNRDPNSGPLQGAAPATKESPGDKEAAPPDKKGEVKLDVLPLDGIVSQIQAQKGKIVVVDTWATWCVPCKKEFPGLVRLNEQHAKDGVVCMSVSVDKTTKHPEAKDFLQQVGAQFANYLTESAPWFDKWNIKGIPVVLVFDREGKLARKFDNDDPNNQFTYADVEKKVEELLHPSR